MSTGTGQGQGGWTVTGQVEVTRPDASGNFTQGVQVYFTTRLGVAASIFVPSAMYTPDTVRQMIAARAAQVDAVQSLAEAPPAVPGM